MKIYPKCRFDTPCEHEAFERNLNIALSNEDLIEIPAIKEEGKILLKSEKWFLCRKTGAVYRYDPPNYPDRGVWEPVEQLINKKKEKGDTHL